MSGGWEPISTAPQDGTVVLGLFQDQPGEATADDAKLRVYCPNENVGWMREGGPAAYNWPFVREPDAWRPLGGA